MGAITPTDASILAIIAYASRNPSLLKDAREKRELIERLESPTAKRIANAMTGEDDASSSESESAAAKSLLNWAQASE